MSEQWNGQPPAGTESYSWHWLRRKDGGSWNVACWRGDAWELDGSLLTNSPEEDAEDMDYHGPLLTPDGEHYGVSQPAKDNPHG